MLIDTHCHLDFKDFDKDRDDVIKRASAEGIKYIINVGSSLEGSRRASELASKYDCIFASMGIHPHEAGTVSENIISEIRDMAKGEKVVAIGEIGLDYYRNSSPREIQKSVFRKFINLSTDLNLPLIIHNREANDDTINILKEEAAGRARGVMHCFSGDEDFLNQCLDIGLSVSFTCNVTFKNAGRLRALIKNVPMDRFFLETDAPFLAPQAFRGQRNEPSYLKYLAREIAAAKGITEEEVADITSKNAVNFFGLGNK